MNYYVKLGLALLNGEQDEVKLLRNSKKAENSLKAQISVRQGIRFNLEDAITTAKESLEIAEVTFTTSEDYIQCLINKKNGLLDAEQELKDFDEVTNYLQETLDKLTKEIK